MKLVHVTVIKVFPPDCGCLRYQLGDADVVGFRVDSKAKHIRIEFGGGKIIEFSDVPYSVELEPS